MYHLRILPAATRELERLDEPIARRIAERIHTEGGTTQKQVVGSITFLRTRYVPPRVSKTAKRTRLASEPFIGMWHNREDLQDSSGWVRSVQQREWVSRRD